jgi:soluble lytic murein transglycosylase-like protein
MEDVGKVTNLSIKDMSVRVAAKNSIPEKLFQKLIQTESAYNPKALSPRGAMGLGQIMPKTANELGLTIGDDKTPGSVWHAESNLDASARYLKKLFDKYQKEGISEKEAWSFAAGAYNAGMGNIARAINKISHEPVKTWDQVAKVLPQVTGKYSQETIRYVNRLRA